MAQFSELIAVVGGTGKLGAALARRWVKFGYRVAIGSRDPAKAREVASSLGAAVGRTIDSGSSVSVARQASLIVVTVPYGAQAETLAEIKDAASGKILVDTTVPLVPPKVMRAQLPSEGSAAVRAQAILGSDTRVVSAFHNVAAHRLAMDAPVDCDVLVFGDDQQARATVIELVQACDLRGVHGGALVNSAAAEALTSVLLVVNRTYSVDGAGLRITGM